MAKLVLSAKEIKKHGGNFTAGEWVVNDGDICPKICIEGDLDWPIAGQVAGPTIEEAEWNALLMVAAPDMYIALKMALLDWNNEAYLKEKTLLRMSLALAIADGLKKTGGA